MSVWDNVNTNIEEILQKYTRLAVVGVSANPGKISYGVTRYMMQAGYEIFPVNPNYGEVLGRTCYLALAEVPLPLEIVNIFRRAEDVLPVVEEAIRLKAKVIWMQLGIFHEAAAQKALEAGLDVVMDACIKVEHSLHI